MSGKEDKGALSYGERLQIETCAEVTISIEM